MKSANAIRTRRKQKRKKPGFIRQEGKIMKKLRTVWRRPKGKHSKLRQNEKSRGKHPSPGYGSPKAVKGLTRSGSKQVRVSNLGQLKGINNKTEVALIAGSVGKAKRTQMIEHAKKHGIKVLNA